MPLAYGGVDHVCVTASIFVPPDTSGHIPDDRWALTFNLNVTGFYLVASSAMFPRDRVIGSLAKYHLAYTEDEETGSPGQQAGAVLRRPGVDQGPPSARPTRRKRISCRCPTA